jgi:hypothetical protein
LNKSEQITGLVVRELPSDSTCEDSDSNRAAVNQLVARTMACKKLECMVELANGQKYRTRLEAEVVPDIFWFRKHFLWYRQTYRRML